MKLGQIFDFLIEEGVRADPRPSRQIQARLRQAKKEFRLLSASERRFFDKERMFNPYADSRIVYGQREAEIKGVLAGIDISVGELLIAKQLQQTAASVDLVVSHHPLGHALPGLGDVMTLQTDMLVNVGLKKKVAEGLMDKRIADVSRRIHSKNHQQPVDAARLLDIPLLCCHTPADNHVAGFLQQMMDRKKPKTLKDVVELLMGEPEYQDAAASQSGPRILVGGPQDKAGRILVDMTGGAEGSSEVFARLSQLGVDTVLMMHCSDGHYSKVKSEYLNVVNAGHMASDSLGLNLIFDKLERHARLTVKECSGFRRFKRHGTHP